MTDEERHGFSPDQMKDIFIKIEMSRMLMRMSTDMTKQIAEDLKLYQIENNSGE
tara:strand:- start:62 stop:223 length:162 start_codon:yes stop_codon:yes gene_type:complete